ncbi:MAG: global cell cycle regulator GcrA-like protein [Alphaproteobacteria bacterium]|nr:global cell cycle regulator GcrA-like protein [Alphaproteobacteria bacterium]
MVWTDDKIKKLKKLWSLGKATAEIAKNLGMSKNSIIGKVHRLDLAARPSPIKVEPKPQKKAPPKKPEIVRLIDLKINTCRWPIGDPTDEDFHFCGEQTVTGKPYCLAHCQEAYLNMAPETEKEKKK